MRNLFFIICLFCSISSSFGQLPLDGLVVNAIPNPKEQTEVIGIGTVKDIKISIYTTISDLSFNISGNHDAIKIRVPYDPIQQRYILIVKPLEDEASKYFLEISGKGYVPCQHRIIKKDGENIYLQVYARYGYEELRENYLYALQELDSLRAILNHEEVSDSPDYDLTDDFQFKINDSLSMPRMIVPTVKTKHLEKQRGFDTFEFNLGVASGAVVGDIMGLYAEMKFGSRNGIAIEVGTGAGIMYNISKNIPWSVALKGYVRNFSLSAGFGVTLPVYGVREYDSEDYYNNGVLIEEYTSLHGKHSFNFLFGYDRCFGRFHFSVGAGIIVPVVDKEILFGWNLSLGYNLFNIRLKNE